MVLNQAARLTDDPQVRFAALMHDLGKGTTSAKEWPAHHGHEARGAKLVEKLCQRYKIPNAYRELAIMAARYHLTCHRIMEMKTETILKKLEALDAFRRPERFEKFLLACEADARGRAGFEDREYPQADYFREALRLAVNIDTSILVEQGLVGEEMARHIKQLRLSALEHLRKNSK
jgi:tRNA nucleotidyltransferase (CCA-adding enzyme)